MGMLMLIGLSAKNAILYLDFVVERIDRMPLKDALIEAAKLRFRPIIMTTLTVLVISIPLVFSTGQGSEFGQRMGVVMFGGIMFSAILTFFLVPAAFFLFEGKRKISFSAAKAEIDAACADIEHGILPEGCDPEREFAVATGTLEGAIGLVDEESSSADRARQSPRSARLEARAPRRRAPRAPSGETKTRNTEYEAGYRRGLKPGFVSRDYRAVIPKGSLKKGLGPHLHLDGHAGDEAGLCPVQGDPYGYPLRRLGKIADREGRRDDARPDQADLAYKGPAFVRVHGHFHRGPELDPSDLRLFEIGCHPDLVQGV